MSKQKGFTRANFAKQNLNGFTLVRSAKVNTLGFTLIELLIVITIIGILMMTGVVVYTSFLKSSRDAKRQSDLKFIQSALEQYFADQKYYPPQAQVSPGGSLSFGNKTYLTTIPNDPTKNPDYSYIPSADSTNYCLFAKLENTTLPNSPGCTPSGAYTFGLSKP